MLSMIPSSTNAAAMASMASSNGIQQFANFYIPQPINHQVPLSNPSYISTDQSTTAVLINYDCRLDMQQKLSRDCESVTSCDSDKSMVKFKNSMNDSMDDEDTRMTGDEKMTFRQAVLAGKLASKVCRVCGDRALGYNFNVVSCESCKAFFRRNATKKKEFRCPFNENCDVTTLSRRFCQKCRLKKCFDVGMKKEWIMNEEQRLQKRKRIEENRQKRRTVDTDDKGGLEKQSEPAEMDSPAPSSKTSRSEQPNLTNAGFSPGIGSPVLGSDYSPPNSNDSAQKTGGHSVINERSRSVPNEQPGSVIKSRSACSGSSRQSFDINLDMNNDSSTITIPKAVLINLINQCHATQRELSNSLPPVVIRAHRLYNGTSEESDEKCICHCTCGARRTGSCIGPKLVDRGCGPDDEIQSSTEGLIQSAIMEYSESDQKMTVSSMDAYEPWLNADYARSFGLTLQQEWKLRELFIANQVIDEWPYYSDPNGASPSNPMDLPIVGRECDATGPIDPADVIHMTDVCVRRIIKMCKRLSAFKSLCQDDQVALLKGGCTDLMILRGVMTFIPSKECWRPVGWRNQLLSLDVMKSVKGNVYEKHKQYLHSFRDEWRTSNEIMLCLAAIALFNPERPNLVHVDAVRMERELYMDLLKRHLDLMYGVDSIASEEALKELLQRVIDVSRLNDYTATIFLDVNPRDVEPLLIEVFDLK